MQDVIRFWLDRGVDGFRIDAIDRLVKDSELRDDPPASAPFPLPLPEESARLEHVYSSNSPDIRAALAALREAAGDALLVGEVYLPPPTPRPTSISSTQCSRSSCSTRRGRRRRCERAIEASAALDRERPASGAPPGCSPTTTSRACPRASGEKRARGRRAAAHAPRPRVPLPGRGDRTGRRPGWRAHLRPRRPRRHRHPMQWEPDPRDSRLHRRGALAAACRPGATQRDLAVGPGRLAARALPQPDRAAPPARRAAWRC